MLWFNRRPRYAPKRAFPPYAHLPGSTPHPERDPAGHSHGLAEPAPAPLDPDEPFASEPYLYGFDLFNHGYFWEAHAAWESLWHAAGREGPVADLLKALIKLAAAGVKARQQQGAGVISHARGAAALLRSVQADGVDRLAGVGLEELAQLADDVADAQPEGGAHPDLDGARFGWTLRPER